MNAGSATPLVTPELMRYKEIKAPLIATIDSEKLMPGCPDCAAQARKHSVAFGDFTRRVKAAAGMY
jgi:hypothetical protein